MGYTVCQAQLAFTADEEGDAELCLQLHQLPAERRLRHMQRLCGAGDVFLAHRGQKIAQAA